METDRYKTMHPYFRAALIRSGLAPRTHEAKRVLLGKEIGARARDSKRDLSGFSPRDLAIRYREGHSLVTFTGSALLKPLLRYDFREEWNNLGYGAIPLNSEDPFGLAGAFEIPPSSGGEVFAEIVDLRSGEKLADYAWLQDTDQGAELWFNREVGPIDGYDWVIVENFFSQHRFGDLPCFPVISEIPEGFEAAFTMRIDCDEAVASGRRLFELYASRGIPFGLAIKTLQSLGEADRALMADVIAAGGSVVSHSHTHQSNWSGNNHTAAWEIRESHKVLKSLGVEGINYEYVVSPFRQNSPLAVEGLKAEGIRGFVGGIICNDPEFLMARAGQVPLVGGIISHSQQCMLHGETVQEAGGSLAVYEQAFRQAVQTQTFFGFLDHPFSQYWYGWESEEARLDVHRRFLDFISGHKNVWQASLVDALRFLDMKAQVEVASEGRGHRVRLKADSGSARFEGLPALTVVLGSKRYSLSPGGEVLLEG